MAEAAIDRAIARELKRLGAWHFKSTGVSVAGIPDRIGCLHGRALVLEVKQPGNYPTKKQRWMLEQAANAGAISGVVRSVADLRALLAAHGVEVSD